MIAIKAQIIDQNSIRILLSEAELSKNGLDPYALSQKSEDASEFLSSLIKTAGILLKKELTLSLCDIEIYPYADGGCLIYLSQKSAAIAVQTARFYSLRDAVRFCRTLNTRFSSLYRANGAYVLLFSSDEHEKMQSEAVREVLDEYAELIIDKNAAELLSALI